MLTVPLDMKTSKPTITVTDTKFTKKLKEYLENEKFRKIYRVSDGFVHLIIPERHNFILESFYGARVIVTLIENTNPKRVQFYFQNRRSAMDIFKEDLEKNKFWEGIERTIDLYLRGLV